MLCKAVEAFHPAVDINHWVFDEQGRCINELLDPPPYNLTGFSIPHLKEKIQKAGLANILITDHVTAQMLLAVEE